MRSMVIDLHVTLGQQGVDARALFYAIILIVIALIGFLVIIYTKKRLFDESSSQNESSETLMESIERMKKSGEISDMEYKQARQALIEKAKESMERSVAERDKKSP